MTLDIPKKAGYITVILMPLGELNPDPEIAILQIYLHVGLH